MKKKKAKVREALQLKSDPDEIRQQVITNMIDIISDFTIKNHMKIPIWRMNDPNVPTRIKRVIRSGLPNFDLISARTPMGNCGLPIGRQVEFSGPESSGKTSIVCQIAGSAQRRMGWNVVWLEHENKLDPFRASTLGLLGDNTLFLQPDCLEDTIEIIDKVMDGMPERNELPDNMKAFGTIIAVDSVAAMPSRTELEGDMNDNNIGVFQRKMSQAQRRITNRLSKRNVTILWINQNRAKLGFGSRAGGVTTYGGNALKYYCAQRWKMWSQKKDDKSIVIHIDNIKNQCGVRPFLKTQVVLNFDEGFDYVDSWADCMEGLGIATRLKNSLVFSDVGKFAEEKMTLRNLKTRFEEDPSVFYEYEKITKDYMKNFNVSRFLKDGGKKDEGEAKEE